MYQIEVKRNLIRHLFHPDNGWKVYVDLDSMEMANGGVHPNGKREAAVSCRQWMEGVGVKIGGHPVFGRTDIVASRDDGKTILIEVEGDTSRQREQAMYSALGQTILLMNTIGENHLYALAVPDDSQWERQLLKIPKSVTGILGLKLYLVSESGVHEL